MHRSHKDAKIYFVGTIIFLINKNKERENKIVQHRSGKSLTETENVFYKCIDCMEVFDIQAKPCMKPAYLSILNRLFVLHDTNENMATVITLQFTNCSRKHLAQCCAFYP